MIINRVLKDNTANLHGVHMLKIFSSENENFLYIIYDGHSEDMCAKYGRSRMNDAHTISLANLVSCPAKVVRSTAFFLDSESIFVRLLCLPLASRLRSQHMNSCV